MHRHGTSINSLVASAIVAFASSTALADAADSYWSDTRLIVWAIAIIYFGGQLLIYRHSGVGWALALRVISIPAIFAWEVWRDYQLPRGIRIFALASAVLQLALMFGGIGLSFALPMIQELLGAR